mgnify:CR=1 FL=1
MKDPFAVQFRGIPDGMYQYWRREDDTHRVWWFRSVGGVVEVLDERTDSVAPVVWSIPEAPGWDRP